MEHKKILSNIIVIALSFLSVYGLSFMFKSDDSFNAVSNSVVSLVLFVGCYFVIAKAIMRCASKKTWILAAVFGLFASTSLVLGSSLLVHKEVLYYSYRTFLHILFGAIPLTCITILSFFCFPKVAQHIGSYSWDYDKLSSRKIFFFSWVLIFLLWIPAFIASYPGVYGYDSIFQLDGYISHHISLQHPIVHTYMLGFFVKTIGMDCFKSMEIGMAFYSIFQMLILSACMAYICCFLKQINVPKLIRIIVLLLFMFLPTNPILAFSSTKDVIYAGTFAVMLICFYKIAISDESKVSVKLLIATIMISFVNLIFRSQAIYVFIITLLFGIILLNKKIKKLLLIVLVSCLAMFLLYSGPLTKLMGGEKFDSVHEMMSVPVSQLSRAALHSNNLSDEEISSIKEYIPDYQSYDNYPNIADGVKNTFNSSLLKESPFGFVKVWVRVGFKCPRDYVEAFARLSAGLWYPDMQYPDPEAYHPYWEYYPNKSIDTTVYPLPKRSTPDGFKWLSDFYTDITYNNSYQKIPVISLLFSSGLAVWILIWNVLFAIKNNNRRSLFVMFFALILWGTLLLGPVVLYRYVYPITVSLPVVLGINIKETNTKIKKSEI